MCHFQSAHQWWRRRWCHHPLKRFSENRRALREQSLTSSCTKLVLWLMQRQREKLQPKAKPINPVEKRWHEGKQMGTALREGRSTCKEVGSIGHRCSIMRWEPVIRTGVRNLQSGRWFNWGWSEAGQRKRTEKKEGTSEISNDWEKAATHRRSIHVFPYRLLMCILKNGTLRMRTGSITLTILREQYEIYWNSTCNFLPKCVHWLEGIFWRACLDTSRVAA